MEMLERRGMGKLLEEPSVGITGNRLFHEVNWSSLKFQNNWLRMDDFTGCWKPVKMRTPTNKSLQEGKEWAHCHHQLDTQ